MKLNNNLILFEDKTNILLYTNNTNAYLIDTSNNRKTIDKVIEYLKDNNLNLKYIINTHSHVDHTKYNYYLKKITNCKITTSNKERFFLENNDLNYDLLSCGLENIIVKNEFFSNQKIKTSRLPRIKNIEYINLKGHSYDMIGILIDDKYFFIGDSIFSLKELKYFPYIYDIDEFLNTLNELKKYKDKIIISSHIGIISNLLELIDLNKKNIYENIEILLSLINNKIDINSLFLKYLDNKSLKTNEITYFLYKKTFNSYVNYLVKNNLVKFVLENNLIYLVN